MYDPPSEYRQRQVIQRANDLFERSYFLGQIKRLWARLSGESRQLPLLSDIQTRYPDAIPHDLGPRPLRIEHIIGTSGKISFDIDFHPLQRRSKNRWTSIAQAMIDDPLSLPLIEVVQIGEDYYVIDGNHRVSVARALGNIYIDGKVIQWEIVAES
jgi:hypothetical protein